MDKLISIVQLYVIPEMLYKLGLKNLLFFFKKKKFASLDKDKNGFLPS